MASDSASHGPPAVGHCPPAWLSFLCDVLSLFRPPGLGTHHPLCSSALPQSSQDLLLSPRFDLSWTKSLCAPQNANTETQPPT